MSNDTSKNPAPSLTRKRRWGGFTLLEITIAVLLMSLIFFATLALFASTSTNGLRVTALTKATLGSAEAMQIVGDDVKEAFDLALPDGSNPAWPLSTTAGFKTSSTPTRYTGIFLYSSQQENVTVAGGTARSINMRSGIRQPYAYYYRGTPTGDSDPDNGTCLWKKVLATNKLVLITSNVAGGPNAIQFRRLTTGLTGSIEIKIVCGEGKKTATEGSLITEQTTEKQGYNSGTDNASVVAGRVVLPRNSSLSLVPQPVTSPIPAPSVAVSPTPPPTATPPPTPTVAPTATPTVAPTATPTATPTGGTTGGGTTGSTTSGGSTTGPTPSPTASGGSTTGGSTGSTTSGGSTTGSTTGSTPTPTPTAKPTASPTPSPTPTPTAKPTPSPSPSPTRPPLSGSGR